MSFHNAIATIGGVLVMAVTLIIVIDSGGRFLLNSPLPGAVEISRVIFAWIVFLPLGYALIRGAHVQVTLLLTRLPPQRRLIADTLILLLGLTLFGMATYAGWNEFWKSFTVGEQMAAPIWIPYWLAVLAIPTGCFFMSFQLLVNLVVNIRQLSRRTR